MIKQVLIYWRNIPSQVVLQRGRTRAKVQLSQRFQEAIDRAAMRAGKGSSDAYLSEWRRETSSVKDDGDLQAMAEQTAADLETQFSDEQLTVMIRSHGNNKS